MTWPHKSARSIRQTRRHTWPALLVAILLGVALTVAGEENSEDEQPTETAKEVFVDETIVVAPYRVDGSAPVSHADLDRETLEQRSYGQEPSLVISETPSMTFYTDSGGLSGYSYFRLRGIDQTRINVTLDGVPLNEPEDQGVYFSNYPDILGASDSVQIQRGVGTSSNGVASFAGSLSLSSRALWRTRGTNLTLGLGSNNAHYASASYSSPLGDQLTFGLRASYVASDGFKHHSDHESASVFYKLGWASGQHMVKLSGFAGHQENQLAWIGVTLEELEEDPRANGNSPDETDRFGQSLTMLQHIFAIDHQANLTSCLYYGRIAGDYDFDLDNFLGFGPGTELYNYDLSSELLGAFVNFSRTSETVDFHAGLQGSTYERRHVGSERTAGRLYDNTGFKDEVSAFIKADVQLDRWLIFGDIQLRKAWFDYRGSVSIDKLSWSFINPRLGASRQLSDFSTLYLSIGRTGREPTRNDLFGGMDDLGVDEDGNPLLYDIPAEEVVDYELGIRIDRPRWSVHGNLYWMEFTNEITLNGQFGPNGLPLHSGVAESHRAGLELKAQVDVGAGFALANTLSVSDNQIREDGVDFEPVLTPTAVINQDFIYARGPFAGSLRVRYQDQSWVDLANTVELPSYTVVDATVSYTWRDLRFDLHALNLLDKHAPSYGSVSFDGTPLYFLHPPRSVFLKVGWTS